MEPIGNKPIRVMAEMADHLACDKSCEAQMISALTPAKPIQLATMATSANKAVLCVGFLARATPSSGESSLDMSVPSIWVVRLASEMFLLVRPIVPGWYLRIKTHTATIV